jgi:hypothetical protein
VMQHHVMSWTTLEHGGVTYLTHDQMAVNASAHFLAGRPPALHVCDISDDVAFPVHCMCMILSDEVAFPVHCM